MRENKDFNKNFKNRLASEKLKAQIADFNAKYPVGTKVLFQGDGMDEAIVTATRSPLEKYSTYAVIFLEGVSGSYFFDDKFVRVLDAENAGIKVLR